MAVALVVVEAKVFGRACFGYGQVFP